MPGAGLTIGAVVGHVNVAAIRQKYPRHQLPRALLPHDRRGALVEAGALAVLRQAVVVPRYAEMFRREVAPQGPPHLPGVRRAVPRGGVELALKQLLLRGHAMQVPLRRGIPRSRRSSHVPTCSRLAGFPSQKKLTGARGCTGCFRARPVRASMRASMLRRLRADPSRSMGSRDGRGVARRGYGDGGAPRLSCQHPRAFLLTRNEATGHPRINDSSE